MKGLINLNSIVVLSFFINITIYYSHGLDFDFEDAQRGTGFIQNNSQSLFLLGTFFCLFVTNKFNIKYSLIPNFKLWIIYLIYFFIISIFRNSAEIKDFYNFANNLFSYLILLCLLQFVYKINFHLLEHLFLLISFFILVFCVIFHLFQGHKIVFFPDRSSELFERLGGLFYYAHTSAIASIVFLFSFIQYKNYQRYIFILLMLFSFIALIATDTRSAWFATFFSLVIISKSKKYFYRLFLLIIIIYFLIIPLLSFLEIPYLGALIQDIEFRKAIWFYSINLGFENLFTGFGSEAFKLFRTFQFAELKDPHNSFISLYLQSGIGSVILFTIIFFKNCSLALKKKYSDYQFLYFFWFFFSFFWGNLFNSLSSFISMYLMFTIYAFTLNPNLEDEK